MKSEAAILANVMDKTRTLTGHYLKILNGVDLHKRFEHDGKSLNSVFWIMAHLPVTENFLLLRAIGGEQVKIPWGRQFSLGSVPISIQDSPSVEEVQAVFDEVHSKAIKHVAGLDDAFLDQPNATGFEFMGENSVRSLIIHAIRHEGTHAGHLGWLCKLHGLKTI